MALWWILVSTTTTTTIWELLQKQIWLENNKFSKFRCLDVQRTVKIKKIINTFAQGLIQMVRVKTVRSHMALCGRSSGLVSTTDPVKSSRLGKSCILRFGWCGFFASDIISGGLLGHLGPISPGPGPKLLDGSISLKFLLETRLQSASFDTFWTESFDTRSYLLNQKR